MIQPEVVFKNLYPAAPIDPVHVTEWTVPADLPYLQGHFPGTPILPAVAIVDASTYFLQCALNRPELRVQSVTVAKFMSPIVPGQTVRIALESLGDGAWQVDWKEATPTARLLATLRVQI